MSVDGEIITDLPRLLDASEGSDGFGLMAVVGGRGCGTSGVLRSLLTAPQVDVLRIDHLQHHHRSLLASTACVQQQQSRTLTAVVVGFEGLMGLSDPAASMAGSEVVTSVVPTIKTPSASTHVSNGLTPLGLAPSSSPSVADVVLVVDDWVGLLRMLHAVDAVWRMQCLVNSWRKRCVAGVRGAVLVTCPSQRSLPEWLTGGACLTATYQLPPRTAPSVTRCLRELLPVVLWDDVARCCNDVASASGEDKGDEWNKPRLALAAAMVTSGVAQTLSAALERTALVQRHCHIATGINSASTEGDGSGGLIERHTGSRDTPLHGLDDVVERVRLLCQVHAARHAHMLMMSETADMPIRTGGVAAAASSSTGVLLHGPSGCGKSSVVRAVAAALNHSLPFFFVQGSRLYAKFLGESEQRLRSVFSTARRHQPCVLVIEDIDVISLARSASGAEGGSGGGGADVTRRMLAALLCELDGVESSRGVLVMGTTNQPHSIDSAVLRQGRLETIILVPPMSVEAVATATEDFIRRFLRHSLGSGGSRVEGSTHKGVGAPADEVSQEVALEVRVCRKMVGMLTASLHVEQQHSYVPPPSTSIAAHAIHIHRQRCVTGWCPAALHAVFREATERWLKCHRRKCSADNPSDALAPGVLCGRDLEEHEEHALLLEAWETSIAATQHHLQQTAYTCPWRDD